MNIKEESEFEKETLLDLQDEPEYDSNIELHDEPLDDTLFEPQGAPSHQTDKKNSLRPRNPPKEKTDIVVKAKIICPFCSFATTKIKWLNDHKVCMHPNKGFTCKICVNSYKKNKSRRKCKLQFSSQLDLDSHRKKWHNCLRVKKNINFVNKNYLVKLNLQLFF